MKPVDLGSAFNAPFRRPKVHGNRLNATVVQSFGLQQDKLCFGAKKSKINIAKPLETPATEIPNIKLKLEQGETEAVIVKRIETLLTDLQVSSPDEAGLPEDAQKTLMQDRLAVLTTTVGQYGKKTLTGLDILAAVSPEFSPQSAPEGYDFHEFLSRYPKEGVNRYSVVQLPSITQFNQVVKQLIQVDWVERHVDDPNDMRLTRKGELVLSKTQTLSELLQALQLIKQGVVLERQETLIALDALTPEQHLKSVLTNVQAGFKDEIGLPTALKTKIQYHRQNALTLPIGMYEAQPVTGLDLLKLFADRPKGLMLSTFQESFNSRYPQSYLHAFREDTALPTSEDFQHLLSLLVKVNLLSEQDGVFALTEKASAFLTQYTDLKQALTLVQATQGHNADSLKSFRKLLSLPILPEAPVEARTEVKAVSQADQALNQQIAELLRSIQLGFEDEQTMPEQSKQALHERRQQVLQQVAGQYEGSSIFVLDLLALFQTKRISTVNHLETVVADAYPKHFSHAFRQDVQRPSQAVLKALIQQLCEIGFVEILDSKNRFELTHRGQALLKFAPQLRALFQQKQDPPVLTPQEPTETPPAGGPLFTFPSITLSAGAQEILEAQQQRLENALKQLEVTWEDEIALSSVLKQAIHDARMQALNQLIGLHEDVPITGVDILRHLSLSDKTTVSKAYSGFKDSYPTNFTHRFRSDTRDVSEAVFQALLTKLDEANLVVFNPSEGVCRLTSKGQQLLILSGVKWLQAPEIKSVIEEEEVPYVYQSQELWQLRFFLDKQKNGMTGWEILEGIQKLQGAKWFGSFVTTEALKTAFGTSLDLPALLRQLYNLDLIYGKKGLNSTKWALTDGAVAKLKQGSPIQNNWVSRDHVRDLLSLQLGELITKDKDLRTVKVSFDAEFQQAKDEYNKVKAELEVLRLQGLGLLEQAKSEKNPQAKAELEQRATDIAERYQGQQPTLDFKRRVMEEYQLQIQTAETQRLEMRRKIQHAISEIKEALNQLKLAEIREKTARQLSQQQQVTSPLGDLMKEVLGTYHRALSNVNPEKIRQTIAVQEQQEAEDSRSRAREILPRSIGYSSRCFKRS